MKSFIRALKRLLTVPSTFDPDDLRRRRVLNFLLIFLLLASAVPLVVIGWDETFVEALTSSNAGFVVPTVLAIGLTIVLLGLNRWKRTPANLVGWIFVLGMVGLVAVMDFPKDLTRGRSVFAWAIPVILSVVALPPAAVFVVDFFITILFMYWAGFRYDDFQIFTITEIYIVSLISWLGMSIAERAIRDAHNESRKNIAILEGVAEGVIVLGRNNQIVLANRAASDLMGSEMVRIIPMTESAEIDGRTLSFHWSQVEGVGLVAIVRDVSRQLEVDRAKDAILRVVSHEMRTPLAAIMGFAEVLESRPVPGMATRIWANGQRMLKLVNDLLDVAQLQAGALAMHRETFSLSGLAQYIIENFLKLADEKGIVLDVHISSALPEHIVGDVQRLEQVLSNLVENAIKFTEKDGRVDVSFCTEGEVDWQIVVKDTGIGIPPERLSDIFEPFRRASDYARRKHQGIGLGLSIVKKIAQLSGGDVSVESTVGRGSTFTVTLPTE
jgi:signal transduction histidine kinase